MFPVLPEAKRGPGELREAVLSLLFRQLLFQEKKRNAYQIAKEFRYPHYGDYAVERLLKEFLVRGLVVKDEDGFFEIRKEGFFELLDSLSKSKRIDELERLRPSNETLERMNYDRLRAEKTFTEWHREWESTRKDLAVRVTNLLVGSAP
jgi:hypothetical protein